MSFQKMYGLRGPWGQMAVLQLTYELRPKWNKNNKNKTQNAVSRSDPLQGSDKYAFYSSLWVSGCFLAPDVPSSCVQFSHLLFLGARQTQTYQG